jgi:hypothetical protein
MNPQVGRRCPAAGIRKTSFCGAKIALIELVVHGSEIATATGQAFDLPEHTFQACFEHVAVFVRIAPAGPIGSPVEVSPDAALLDRILAITGRAP